MMHLETPCTSELASVVIFMIIIIAQVQGGGTGGLSFFDTIFKAATWPIEAPHQDMSAAIVATPSMSPGQGGQGGLVATISDLHHEHHTARPELYVPKVGS